MPDAEHLISYHVVTEGARRRALADEKPVRLESGDVIVFPHGDPHVMSSAPGLEPDSETSPERTYTGRG